MSFYQQLFIYAGLFVGVLLCCFIIIKGVVGNELRQSLPPQIQQAQKFFKGKEVKLIVNIASDGKVSFDNFEVMEKIDYAG